MAFEHRLAYRYTTGEVEGFVGTALSNANNARNDALRKIRDKIQVIQDTRREPAEPNLDESRIIEKNGVLSPDELKIVREHWEISRKSDTI